MAIDPANFTTTIDNPNFSLKPGTTFVYSTPDGSEIVRFKVTDQTKVVDGVTCVVVRDIAVVEGVLHEDTIDYFAQDNLGNVWYFGEEVKNYVNGKFDNTHGSWLAGVNGDPGIVMQAAPTVGLVYNQENAPGIAQDMAEVLSLDAQAVTPYGDFSSVLQTHDFTPLEPSLNEQKFYVAGIGLVRSNKPDTGESEQLVKIEFDGTAGADTMAGNIGRDELRGHNGSDTIDGKAGDDILTGGLGKDLLTGGAGRDTFDFNAVAESGVGGAKRDVVTDFFRGVDHIDLRTIDAQQHHGGNQAFQFIGKQAFHHTEGELHYRVTAAGVIVEGDVNGDGRADFQIEVANLPALSRGDFLL